MSASESVTCSDGGGAVAVGAILEHEAIAGLSAGKPTGLRGRLQSSGGEDKRPDYSLDSLMKSVSTAALS